VDFGRRKVVAFYPEKSKSDVDVARRWKGGKRGVDKFSDDSLITAHRGCKAGEKGREVKRTGRGKAQCGGAGKRTLFFKGYKGGARGKKGDRVGRGGGAINAHDGYP